MKIQELLESSKMMDQFQGIGPAVNLIQYAHNKFKFPADARAVPVDLKSRPAATHLSQFDLGWWLWMGDRPDAALYTPHILYYYNGKIAASSDPIGVQRLLGNEVARWDIEFSSRWSGNRKLNYGPDVVSKAVDKINQTGMISRILVDTGIKLRRQYKNTSFSILFQDLALLNDMVQNRDPEAKILAEHIMQYSTPIEDELGHLFSMYVEHDPDEPEDLTILIKVILREAAKNTFRKFPKTTEVKVPFLREVIANFRKTFEDLMRQVPKLDYTKYDPEEY